MRTEQQVNTAIETYSDMVLCLSGAGLWFRPVKRIGLDINPSVEIRGIIGFEKLDDPCGEK